jgi:predicted DNA-binding transcriptional regulator YafY
MSTDTKTHRILRFILFLSNSYPKSKDECIAFLGIGDTAFYSYCNTLKETGFDLHQKDGKYWLEYTDQDFQVLRNVFHFSEEEAYLLSRAIDAIEVKQADALRLKQKLTAFLNQDKVIESYIRKEKSDIVCSLRKAQKQRKQILLVNYASGNSQTVKNRMVEPFEFKDDFNLVWAFDTMLKQNRQFKVCRIEDVQETLIPWRNEQFHHSKPVDVFRNTGDLNKQIELRMNLKARNLLIEEYPLSERHLERIENNQYRLTLQVAKYEGPGRFVMGLIDDIQIVGDDGFRNYLRTKINNIRII